MSNYELSFKLLPTGIYGFCASKTTEYKYSKELTLEMISGFSPRIKTLKHAYDMFLQMMDDDKFNLTFHTSLGKETSSFDAVIKSDDDQDSDEDIINGEEKEEDTTVSNVNDGQILCQFSHDMYGIEISFVLDKIQDGIIIYDIKSEKRLRQLEKQLKGVFFLEKCNKPIRMTSEKLVLCFNYLGHYRSEFDGMIGQKVCSSSGMQVSFGNLLECFAYFQEIEAERDHKFIFKGHDISPLSLLTEIKSLEIFGNVNITNLEPLRELETLEEITLCGCTQITDISPISKLPNLKKLDLKGCTGIVDVRPLSLSKSLTKLNLANTNVRNVLCLKQLPNLVIEGI